MNKIKTHSSSLIHLWCWLLINFAVWLFIGSLGCVASAIIFVAMKKYEGFTILQNLIQQDYHYLIQYINPDSDLLINNVLHKINSNMIGIQIELPKQLSFMRVNLYKIIQNIMPYYTAVLLGLNLLAIRLYLLLRWCPLFFLLGLAGLVDGLTQRNIRRANAGRESALIYHQAKSLILFSLILGIFTDLILPIGIEQSELVIVISAVLFGLAIQITAKSFKKYL